MRFIGGRSCWAAGIRTRLRKTYSMKDRKSATRLPDRIGCHASGLAWSIALVGVVLLSQASSGLAAATNSNQAERKLLYVAVPGIRNYLEYGGHGVLVSTSITVTA